MRDPARSQKVALSAILARSWRSVLAAIVASLAFGLSYSQMPLFSSNQNTYMLHGLAQAGDRLLRSDWLAGTTDPTPVFSALVKLTYRFLGVRAFYLYALILMGVYLYSLLGIASFLGLRQSGKLLLVMLLALHSKLLAYGSLNLLGWDMRALLFNGVAGQYVVGPTFQPSMFGILLLTSIYAFVRNRFLLSTVLLVIAATMHPTYLLISSIFATTYISVRWFQDKQARNAWQMGAVALVGLFPIAFYVYSHFGPASPEQFQRAQEILATLRIPHHALPGVWFDWTVVFKLALILSAIYLVKRTRLFWILLGPFCAAYLLIAAQIITGSNQLALLFPWRISALLVPLATTVVLGSLLAFISRRAEGWARRRPKVLMAGLLAVMIGCAGSGAYVSLALGIRQAREANAAMKAFVERTKTAGDVYLVPPEWETFRLDTGVPLFIDWKSHPYKDTEVLTWYERVKIAQQLYAGIRKIDGGVLQDICQQGGVTHVVLPTARATGLPPWLVEVYRDPIYSVYHVVARTG